MSKKQQKNSNSKSAPDLETLRAKDAAKKENANAVRKKQRKRRWIPIGAAACGLLLLGSGYALLRGGSAALHRKIIAETEHFQVTAAMFDCYFRQCTDSYLAYAEGNSGTAVYDETISLKDQEYSSGVTWFDMFTSRTMNAVKQNLQLCEAAYAAGFTLSDEQLAHSKAAAEQADLSHYPKGVRTEDLEEAAKLTVLAEQYQSAVKSQMTVTDEEVEAYYQAHSTEYLTISVLAYSFPWSPEGVINGDLTEHDAAISAAEALADCTSQQEYTEYVYRYLTEQKGLERTEAEQIAGDLVITKYLRDFPAEVQEWALSNAARGAVMLLKREDQCYATVYLLREEPKTDESKTVDFRVLYMSTAEFDGVDNAVSFAEELRDTVTAEGGTSQAFAELAMQYSEDAATYANGGLVTGYSTARTTYGDETAAWVFDRERQAGDMTVIARTGAVLLLYFEGANTESGWKNQAREDLYSAQLSAFTNDFAQYEVTVYDENYKYIKV